MTTTQALPGIDLDKARADFEKYGRDACGMTSKLLERSGEGRYHFGRTADMWGAYQAALIAQARAAQAASTLTATQITAGAAVLGDDGKPIGRNTAIMVADAMGVAAQGAVPVGQQASPTDLSRQLRDIAKGVGNGEYTQVRPQMLNAAAEEIERYYGGMLAWKKTAEKKHRDWNAERMGRIDERCAARAATAATTSEDARDARIAVLEKALTYYAEGNHLILADADAWDTVSGEPMNFLCDDAGTATVEDGTVAKCALAGDPLADDEERSVRATQQEGGNA